MKKLKLPLEVVIKADQLRLCILEAEIKTDELQFIDLQK